ncbi:2-C-methyl-D-erythritol 2,4-cyclodiphosphate synthase [Salininema proteolyticum]|uniref:2-C-methyl-D-erythritol 2,4-cyclodiphosphate synthase n=1 Tax=Salininema proteolyticum TaxID=1607685 RepID=A0ABV8U2Z1_9ACTN
MGHGSDVHRFDSDTPCRLACLDWPSSPGLAGHSDGDAAAHAACDAMLTAAGLGDLGANFGASRPEWAGASGEALLRETVRRLGETRWRVVNLSVQIIGERPKIAPRRAEAEKAMTSVVGAPVRISATTTDGLGFTGRGEGLAATATALLYSVPA